MSNNFVYKPIVAEQKTKDMAANINRYYQNDIWDLKDPLFNDLQYTGSRRFIKFTIKNQYINTELKKYYISGIDNGFPSIGTLVANAGYISILDSFFDKYYPNVKSLLDLDIAKARVRLSTFLIEKNTAKKTIDNCLGFLKSSYEFVFDYYDEREEIEKDCWDFRKIPNAKYPKNHTTYSLNFSSLPSFFKESVKSYCKLKLSNTSITPLINKVNNLEFFFKFLKERHPTWTNFNELSRYDIESYLSYLNQYKGNLKSNTRWRYITTLEDYLLYLQKREDKIAPIKPVFNLIFKEDLPKIHVEKETIKYIPDEVVSQLENLLNTTPEDLKPAMTDWDRSIVPIVILLLATGWRINDISNLRYHNCLLYNDGWYLQGDINKTEVKEHRVPIEDEVAKLVQAIAESTKNILTKDNNSDKYLFPTLKGARKGMPIASGNVESALNRWSKDYHILDEHGNPYKFNNHAFRHTKGVELINNGMNLIHVQKWMAHASPEMTLVYAKVTDQTLRKEWIEAKEKSSFLKIDLSNGKVSEMNDEDLLEWEYIRHNIEAAKVPMGYCMASQKLGCPYVETPCLTCNNFCTTPDNLQEFEAEIKSLEELIARTKDMPVWNEKNQKRYEKITQIRDTLAQGKIHHPSGKKAREYPKTN